VLVVTGAGVFLIWTLGALHKIEIELLGYRFAICRVLDLDDDGEVVAFRKSNVGHENITLLSKAQANWVAATASDDFDDLLADGLSFLFLIYGSDLHFAIVGNKELKVRFNSCEKPSAVGAVFDTTVLVAMIVFFTLCMSVVVAIGMSVVVVVVVVVVMFVVGATDWNQGKCDCCEDEGDRLKGLFHNVRIVVIGVRYSCLLEGLTGIDG
jgi:hypothetical protein